MSYPKPEKIFTFMAVVMLLSSSAIAAGSGTSVSPGTAKKRVELEKTFLLRSSDELDQTLALVNETTDLLIAEVEAAAGREAYSKTDERLALLDWYQRYVEWLKGTASELDRDVSAFFAGRHFDPRLALRFDQFTSDSRTLAGALGGRVREMDGEKEKIEARMGKVNTAVVERRVLVDRDDLELARELWPTYKVSYDRREAVYKELSDEEVLYLQNELRALGEKQKYFECLSELGRYELVWLEIQAGRLARSSGIARVIDGDDPAAIADAYRDAIRTYEAHAAALKRTSSELDAKMHAITKSGSLKTLDLQEELSRYYEKMKNRFDRRVEWLSSQIGGCQADLVEINREIKQDLLEKRDEGNLSPPPFEKGGAAPLVQRGDRGD